MSDYRLIIRVKNNLLYGLMEKHGIKSQLELARVLGAHPSQIGDVANLRVGAFNADGSPSKITEKLCEYFGVLPEDIYPPEVLNVGIPNNVIERIVSSEEVSRYLMQTDMDPLRQLEDMIDTEFMKKELSRLTTTQRRVIEMRFFEGKLQKEIAKELGVSCNRVHQIEKQAIDRLRRVLVHEPPESDNDASVGGLATRLANAIARRDATLSNE